MTNPIKYREQAREEHDERKAGEHEKAIQKYGLEAATKPSGHPEFDVMDFAVNELIGLERYGEMIENRARECLDLIENLPRGTRAVFRDAIVVGKEIAAQGEALAVELMEIRLALKAAGLMLGTTERTR